jgi:hypothetical protein
MNKSVSKSLTRSDAAREPIMGSWDTAEKVIFARKARELLQLSLGLDARRANLDCTVTLAALTLLLANTHDWMRGFARDDSAAKLDPELSHIIESYRTPCVEVDGIRQLIPTIDRCPIIKSNTLPSCVALVEGMQRHQGRERLGTFLHNIRNAVAHGNVYWLSESPLPGSPIRGVMLAFKVHSGDESHPPRWRAYRMGIESLASLIEALAALFGQQPVSLHLAAAERVAIEAV